jgi:hypothetical protein
MAGVRAHLGPSYNDALLFAKARPAILHAEQTLEHLVSIEKRKKEVRISSLSESDKRTKAGSCTVDLLVERYTTMDGKPLKKPLCLGPNECAIGYTSLGFSYPRDGSTYYLVVDTRSRAARHGLVCRGFYTQEGVRHSLDIGADAFITGEPLAFMFRNYSKNMLVVPDFPVQVYIIKRVHEEIQSPLALSNNGINVTVERLCRYGFFTAYTVGLAEEIAFIKKAQKPLHIDEDNSRYLERMTIREALSSGFPDGFFLANTGEKIHTNGSPAYMFPFHPRRISEGFTIPTFHAFLAMREFTDRNNLPVTANAGILNPGTDGTVVYECIGHKRRNLREYLSTELPFAFVIPLPFADGALDTSYGNARHGVQDSIGF